MVALAVEWKQMNGLYATRSRCTMSVRGAHVVAFDMALNYAAERKQFGQQDWQNITGQISLLFTACGRRK